MNIEQSVTSENQMLYKEVVSKAQISFEIDASETCWTAKTTGKDTYLITALDNSPSPESLTHELLHIQLDLNGFVSTEEILENQRFVFCQWQLIDAINNNLAHFHMLEPYLSLGFHRDKFLSPKPTDIETEYFADVATLDPKEDPLQYVNFLLQTIIETNWYKKWLSLNTQKVDDDLKAKNEKIFDETNSIIEKWFKSSVENNLETFIELQKVQAAGLKAYR